MTYATSNPPFLMNAGAAIGGKAPRIWGYQSADAAATVAGANYFSNGRDLGMKVGDIVIVYDTASPLVTTHMVLSIGTGTNRYADVGTGTTIGIGSG